jgi:hypothetical protein
MVYSCTNTIATEYRLRTSNKRTVEHNVDTLQLDKV